jgi:hypothetical protein
MPKKQACLLTIIVWNAFGQAGGLFLQIEKIQMFQLNFDKIFVVGK